MKNILLSLSFFVFFTLELNAVPARFAPMQMKQKDGTELCVYLRGDEFFHYYISEDGVPLVQGDDLSYYYAVGADSILVNSGILAHQVELRKSAELLFVKKNKNKAISVIEARSKALNLKKTNLRNAVHKDRTKKIIGQTGEFFGKKKGLVILVNFQDCSMIGSDPKGEFDDFFNEVGYNKNGHIGSVHDYFYDQSYGQFDLSFDVVGPVTVQEPLRYYGANSVRTESDMNVGQMVAEACMLANEYVDFSDYDWDEDGKVDQVFLVYAGYAESSGAPSYTIWPHRFSLSGCEYYGDGLGPLSIDGVIIDDYACSSELAGRSGKTMDGIGTAIHEFSHCLGLPDFYDVGYNGGFGMSAWDIMDAGSYKGPKGIGEVPSGYSAYERWFAGWLTFTELTKGDRIENMPCIGDEPLAYIMYNEGNRNECFILENRQNERWFSYVNTSNNCHGLLVYHVDYSQEAWDKHAINVLPNHQRMSVVPADRDYGYFYNNGTDKKGYNPSDEDFEGDLFPGSKNVKEFTNTSHTNVGGKLFNKNSDGTYNLNKPITNITESDGLISFDFMGGKQVQTPELHDASNIKQDGFTISWESEPVDSFTIEANRVNERTILLSENFDKFETESNEIDGIFDLSAILNSYMQINGWKGKNLYTSNKGIKIGDQMNQGALKTPMMKPDSECITLWISFSSVKRSSPILISLLDKEGYTIDVHKVYGNTEKSDTILWFVNLKPGEYYVSFTCSTPFYIDDLAFFNDRLTDNDVDDYYNSLYSVCMDGIKGFSFTFEDLLPGLYRYRIKAMMGGLSSEWSAYKEVDLQKVDVVSDVLSESKIPIAIYTMNGQKVKEMTTSGVYILDYGINRKKIVYTGK